MNAVLKVQHPTRSTDREANERFVHLTFGDTVMEYENGRRVKAVTAFIRTKDGQELVSFAECDERDQFCRKAGRVVARRKWFNEKRTELVPVILDNDTLYDRVLTTYNKGL